MAYTIKLKRGNEANKPILQNGEPYLAMDTSSLWVGKGNGTSEKFLSGSQASQSVQTKTFAFINPSDNAQSAAFVVDSSAQLSKIRVFATSTPTANTTVHIMRGASNGSGSFTQIATISFTTANPSPVTLSTPVQLNVDDVVYAVIIGAVNGLTNLSVQLVLS